MHLIKEYIIYQDDKNYSKLVLYIFIGIGLFVLVIFPLYGSSWRYEIGKIFSMIFNMIGVLLVFSGVICCLCGIFNFFNHRPIKALGLFFMGFILLTFGGFFLSSGTFRTGGHQVPQGYH